jgi:hypothetical protein
MEIFLDIPGAPTIYDIVYNDDEPTVPDIFYVTPITPIAQTIPDQEDEVNVDKSYEIITSVYDTVCIACNPENNRIKSGICTLSQSYYETTSGYLQSRCRTAAQRVSTTKKAGGVYYPSVNDNIPFEFLYPTNAPNGPQVYQSKNCSNPKTYNNNALNKPANNYCSTIYKPNNPQFAQQGAVSGSTRLQKLKADTITSNGFSFYSAYGATMANAGNFQGTNTSSNYYVKNRNYPLDGFIHLNKYRENKRLACCDVF